MLVIHGKDSAIVLSVETEGRTVDATTAWMVLPNQPRYWLNEDFQCTCYTKYLTSNLSILSQNIQCDKKF